MPASLSFSCDFKGEFTQLRVTNDEGASVVIQLAPAANKQARAHMLSFARMLQQAVNKVLAATKPVPVADSE